MRGKKLVSLVLSVLLALGAAMPLALADDAADVGATSQAAMMKEIAAMMPDDIQLPLTDTPVTLTYWWPWEPDVQKMVTTVADTLTAQVMEELTGVPHRVHPPADRPGIRGVQRDAGLRRPAGHDLLQQQREVPGRRRGRR